MKNLVSFISLLALLLVSGCSQEDMLRNGATSTSGEGRTFTTSFENDDSRTYLDDGMYSRWTEGDRISLFDSNTLNNQYAFAGETGDVGGTFFMLSKPEGTGTALSANYAVYPYSEDVQMTEDGVISVTLPSEQHYAENSYGLGDNTMVAVTENADDTFLSFKNVGGCLKLQLYGDDLTVKSITLMGNNGEKIAGKTTIIAAYDKVPFVRMAEDATTSITLDCGEKGVKVGSSAEEATAFWMVVPPVVFEKGITVVVKDIDNNVFIQTTAKLLAIERNVVKPMAAVKVIPENPKISFSEDEEELEGWSAGMFGGDGTYAMGKPHGDNGYMMTMGNVLEEKSAVVYMGESGQVREIFIDNTIITFGENTNGSVEVSIVEQGCEEKIEHITLSGLNVRSRSSDDHGQLVGSLRLVANLKDLYENTKDIIKDGGFSKKSAIKNVYNRLQGLNNLVRATGGPDLLGNALGDIGPWLDIAEGLVQIGELWAMYGSGATAGGAAGACIAIYAGLYATYLDLYDEHIDAYFGNNQVSIKDITYKGDGLNIELAISGCEPWYDVECGVIVKTEAFPAPRYNDGLATKTVVRNGEYIFVEGNVQMDKTYYCRPFLITKDRASLWKGFIGELFGPLVRYGETVKYEPDPMRVALIKLYESTNGDNWTNNTNWCSDKPVTKWYGVGIWDDRYVISLGNNNLTGKIDQTFPDDVKLELNVYDNQLTSLNISDCTALEFLSCDNNQLTSLSVSNCNALTYLGCFNNQLTSLDVSGCTALTNLGCNNNQLTSLDVSNCTALEILSCYNNQLTSLDVSGRTTLTIFSCHSNQLTSLDVSGCTSLEQLYCDDNQLTSLDVSDCTSLVHLQCNNNQLTSLIVSGCTSLETLSCPNNQLTSLNVSGCTSLKSLHCGGNQLTSLDVSDCMSLGYLDCNNNHLTSLDVSGLGYLNCSNNQLTSLDVSGCKWLGYLDCSNNQLPSLDISSCTSLADLYCSNNQLPSLDVSSCTSLVTLWCSSNQLTSLDVSGCTSLMSLYCYVNQLTSLDVSGCTSLLTLICHENQISSVIPDWFSQLTNFQYDQRYTYSSEYTNGYQDNGYGWWYPGEPEKGYHGRD